MQILTADTKKEIARITISQNRKKQHYLHIVTEIKVLIGLRVLSVNYLQSIYFK